MTKESQNMRDAGKSVPSGPATPLDFVLPTWAAGGLVEACQRGGMAAEGSCKLVQE